MVVFVTGIYSMSLNFKREFGILSFAKAIMSVME